MKINDYIKTHWSKILFLLGIGGCLHAITSVEYLITLDGPAHIYNSRIYNDLLSNNSWTQTYFHINEQLTPNYGSLLLLSGLLAVFKSALALKLFHILFVLLFVGGFYIWNKSNTEKRWYLLILPFVFAELFWAGFYNFVLATAILFFVLAFYERTKLVDWKKYSILGTLFLILYFSHSIVFIFGGLALFIFELVKLSSQKNLAIKVKLKPFVFLFLAALPCFLMAFYFMDSRKTVIEYLPFEQLMNDFFEGKVFRVRNDISKFMRPVFPAMVLLLSVTILIQNRLKTTSNYLLVTAIACLFLYFILPDSVGYASVFSARIIYFFWIFLVAWICRNPLTIPWQKFSISMLVIAFLGIQLWSHREYWKILDKNTQLVLEATKFIENESVVYPIFASNLWDELHVSNILGLEKNLFILENTVARSDYFVVQYNEPFEEILNEQPTLDFKTSNMQISIDYVVKIGENDPEYVKDIQLYNQIKSNGFIVFKNEMVEVWKRN